MSLLHTLHDVTPSHADNLSHSLLLHRGTQSTVYSCRFYAIDTYGYRSNGAYIYEQSAPVTAAGAEPPTTSVAVPGLGDVPVEIDYATMTATFMGEKYPIMQDAEGYYIMVNGQRINLPGFAAPTVSASSIGNGTIAVTSTAFIEVSHTGCPGQLFVSTVVAGELTPIVALSPSNLTLAPGQVKILAVSHLNDMCKLRRL